MPQSVDLLANSIVNLSNIQELSMCSLEMFSGSIQQAEQAIQKSCELFDSLE